MKKALGIVAAMLLAAGTTATPAVQAATKAVATRDAAVRDERLLRRLRAGGGGPGLGGYRKRGWSVAEDRRRAAKARNVRRNRAAHR